jgi:hypothetical protein
MSGNGGNPHSLRDLLGTYEKSGLNHLKKEKKALMQQLLTGKRRVQVETEAA